MAATHGSTARRSRAPPWEQRAVPVPLRERQAPAVLRGQAWAPLNSQGEMVAQDSMAAEAAEAAEGLPGTGPRGVLLRRPATGAPAEAAQPTAVRSARTVQETRAARAAIIV